MPFAINPNPAGFGFIANGTIVDSKTSYDDMDLSQQFVVSGISDSANLIGFYEKNGLSIRIAYNWRDKFLARNLSRQLYAIRIDNPFFS